MAKAVGRKSAAAKQELGWTWTNEKRARFLAELAETANVVRSARAVGMHERSPYKERERNPQFRAGWEAALEQGFDKLELLLLERATHGETPPPDGKGGVGEKQRAISTTLAMNLLKMREGRRAKAKAPPQRPMRGQKLRDQIEARLAEINRRLGGAG